IEKISSGVGTERLLLKSDVPLLPYSFSPDGRFLLYGVNESKSRMDLWMLPLEGDRKPEPFLATPFNEAMGQFSPVPAGGRYWVAYTSDESGAFEVYVESYPRGSGRYLISKGGGTQARWRPDGKELFYVAPDGMLMSVDVRTVPQFHSGVPR